jgi:parallel beta-helix repeat protein
MEIPVLYQVRILRQRVRVPAWFAATIVLSVLVMQPVNAFALSCGDTIVADTALQADLGPCAGIALTVAANDITLSLNGHSIIGAVNGFEGVFLAGITNVVIKGPGTIRGFVFGIGVFAANGTRPISSATTVQHVHFADNSSEGVIFVGGTANRVLYNTFKDNPCIAIKIDAVTEAQVVGNAIKRSNAPTVGNSCGMQQSPTGGGVGIMVVSTAPSAIVKRNSVAHSTNGFFADSFVSPITITNNDFSGNGQDGIATLSEGTITDNRANGNGRDGISIANGSGSIVQNNMANSNGRRGIGLGDLLSQPSGNDNRISLNLVLGNGLDLFWDGNGFGNCWSRNIFDTSSPAPLPACP